MKNDGVLGEFDLNSRFSIDWNSTRVNEMTITESIEDDKYVYYGSFDIDMKFKSKTEDKAFNKVIDESLLHTDGSNQNKYDERCKALTSDKFGIGKYFPIVRPEDDEAGTVDEAIRDWLSQADTREKIAMYDYIFACNIPRDTIMKAWFEQDYELVGIDKRIKSIDFDTRKPKIDQMIINYEDGTWHRFNIKPVSNSDVGYLFPGKSLSSLRDTIHDMLEEDYDGTLELLSELFGFDLKTLKGAKFDG